MSFVLSARNVNDALNSVMRLLNFKEYWREINPRGQGTLEWKGTFITEYQNPYERVLFNSTRDANPFFHFFESLWILAGRDDVEFLAQFNPKMRDYSDNGLIFHAPYGQRLRGHHHFDQIKKAIDLLKGDMATRQVVLTIWDPVSDMGVKTKDMPCNDMIFFKIRDGRLNMTVCCRSNDIIWGAYGANAVQFSMIQEFIARAVGVEVGVYAQVSDSFHVYTDNEAYKKLMPEYYSIPTGGYERPWPIDPYTTGKVKPFRIMGAGGSADTWLEDLDITIGDPAWVMDNQSKVDPFFSMVAIPLWRTWWAYKKGDYKEAYEFLDECEAIDWRIAAYEWMRRRQLARAAK